MRLYLNPLLAKEYKSSSQIARVLTEGWVKENSFCPNCCNDQLQQFPNNSPVADFFCSVCNEEFELKSKNGILTDRIEDGAYQTMVTRIKSNRNPNFFILTYNKATWQIQDFLLIPKHYFIPELIKERKPLSETAQRKGWIGCSIMLHSIPSSGRIFLINNSRIVDKQLVAQQWKQTEFLKNLSGRTKGWVIDILHCIELIPTKTFRLEDIYKFEPILRQKHPKNNFIRDKIRQQLQVLRDEGLIEFIAKGCYQKLKSP